MASIETLPAPLPFEIFKVLPDLKALDALRRSCPLFAAVFFLHAAELLEHFLQTTLLDDVAVEIRAYVLLTAEKSKPQDEDELKSLYARAREPLPRTTPASTISMAVRKFTLSHSLSRAIIQYKLDQLYSLPHEHLEDKAFRYFNRTMRPNVESGSSYSLQQPSLPYWTEEQRLLRAIWRRYMFRALESPDYFPYLVHHEGMYPRDKWQDDELEDVMECIDALHVTGHSCSHPVAILWEALAPVPTSASAASRTELHWGLDLGGSMRSLERPGRGHNWFHGPCLRYRCSPLVDADWKVFRRLGLGIWEYRRLAEELELTMWSTSFKPLPGSAEWSTFKLRSTFGTDDMFYTWKMLYQAVTSYVRDA